MTWGLGDPDAAQAFFEPLLELSYAGQTAYGQQVADGIGRCHVSRGELEPARALLADAKSTWISHSLQPLIDLWDGTGIAPRRWRLECSRPAAGRAIAGTSGPPSTWPGECCSCATSQSAPWRCSNALVGSSTTAVRAT